MVDYTCLPVLKRRRQVDQRFKVITDYVELLVTLGYF